MGEVVTLYRQSFRLKARRAASARDALKKAHAEESLSSSRADSDALKNAKTFARAMRAIGLVVVVDDDRDVVRLECEDMKRAGQEERVFQAIAPFVDKGSFVDVEGHPDEGPVRYAFNGKTCQRRRLKMTDRAWQEYMEKHEAELEAAEAKERPATPSAPWKKLLESKPSAIVDTYDSASAFAPRAWLTHPKFGEGVVIRAGDGKIVVRFEAGERTLAAAR